MKQDNKIPSAFPDIYHLYYDRKYEIVIKLATKFLSENKYNQVVRYYRAMSYKAIGDFENAIIDLKYNISINNSVKKHDKSYISLYFIYYKLGMYKEAYELLPILNKIRTPEYYNKHIKISEIIINNKLGIDFNTNSKYEYLQSQILNYNDSSVLKHIKLHCSNTLKENKSLFESNVNIEYLYEFLNINLSKYEVSNIENSLDIYFFSIARIGFDYKNNTYCNVLKVLAIPQTSNIVNMYPIWNEPPFFSAISVLDIDYDKLFNREKPKVKVMSQIDKFNKRYSRKKY